MSKYAKVTISCDQCGEEIKRSPGAVNEHNFCSYKCKYLWWKNNFRQSKETKIKMSESHMGHNVSPETREKLQMANKGQTSWAKGLKLQPLRKEHKENISISRIGKCIGKNNPSWKGGITPINILIRHGVEFRLWRESVFARDNWTCQKCNQKGQQLHAHHIKPFSEYPELRFAIDNGLTLCKICHMKGHRKNETE